MTAANAILIPKVSDPDQPAEADWIQSLPKAELHLHIEGSLEPELLFELARTNRVDIPFGSVEEIRDAYRFENLQGFLDIYYQGMHVLKTREDFFRLTQAYLMRAAADSVRHTEIFFDPQGHIPRGVSLADVTEGIFDGLAYGQKELGITSGLILCFLRDQSEDDALALLKQAEPWQDRLLGVGLDSAEVGNPPGKFQAVFKRAREMGLRCVAHAGEEGPPEYVRDALDLLRVDRIDHGNRALEDVNLTARLASESVTLTVCPLSNLALCGVDDLCNHPVRSMLQAGLAACLNSDDPAYFGGYIAENYMQTSKALGLTRQEIVELVGNGFKGAFIPDEQKQAHLQVLAAAE